MKLKKIAIMIIFFTMLSSGLFALEKNSIEKDISAKINQALDILSIKNLSKDQQAQKIFNLLDEVFDYSIMSKLALGKQQWATISNSEKKEFVRLFEKKLKQSYVDKLALYDNQKVVILGLKDYQKNRLQLQTELIGKGETYPINYNFYNNKGDWKIYDVDISGVSIIQTYRQQFSGLLKEKSFQEILAQLRSEDIK
ncbi:MAG: ABC transporter substrate-binding protein [Campylobacterales bacterium]|nr:ABC transporter substrate-binding protein [Campylobacterales bacterium]